MDQQELQDKIKKYVELKLSNSFVAKLNLSYWFAKNFIEIVFYSVPIFAVFIAYQYFFFFAPLILVLFLALYYVIGSMYKNRIKHNITISIDLISVYKMLKKGYKCNIELVKDQEKLKMCFDFLIPYKNYDYYKTQFLIRTEIIIDLLREISPKNNHYEFQVKLNPDYELSYNLSEDFSKTLQPHLQNVSFLPENIASNMKNMLEAYFYLNVFENSMRLFLENVAVKKGFELKMKSEIENKAKNRMKGVEENKWLAIKPTSLVFFVDFEDLGKIVERNWDDLQLGHYFTGALNKESVKIKITELYQIRNMIAHNNSVVTPEHIQRIKFHYNDFLQHIKDEVNYT